ncbi:hypothetical protein C2S53_011903 [Perilla frutescens var. hirtella]|uniref:MULE transposase domain-containing protein n=1 Tax=Perilla frutescens var. hirtella TaxID=608512 RepID=A0AAD4NWV3_PERFH|nr:hypothetical protein C2S53_011903 [Perilla frutescens var. hirtella]
MNSSSGIEVVDGLNGEPKKRHRVSRRFGCKAHLFFRLNVHHGYIVNAFIERHTHSLASDAHKKYLEEAVGDYSDIGYTSVEYKNYSCDLKPYIISVDAQMILNKLFLKRELCSAFVFEFPVDDQLTRILWVDTIARKNYTIFGDVVSFDATYSTNRYNMIFEPFTGKDNHEKCVTFGASLLCNEDIESYSWFLTRFKDCMGQAPRMIITDQNPSIKIVVEQVLVALTSSILQSVTFDSGLAD